MIPLSLAILSLENEKDLQAADLLGIVDLLDYLFQVIHNKRLMLVAHKDAMCGVVD